MHPNFFGLALRTPFPTGVFEISNEFFFFVSTEITGSCAAKAAVTL
jgi:hypothetical protein